MAKLFKNEASCTVNYAVDCSDFCMYALSIYMNKDFGHLTGIVHVDHVDLFFPKIISVKYRSFSYAVELNEEVRKYIKNFKISKIKEKSYKELIKFRDST